MHPTLPTNHWTQSAIERVQTPHASGFRSLKARITLVGSALLYATKALSKIALSALFAIGELCLHRDFSYTRHFSHQAQNDFQIGLVCARHAVGLGTPTHPETPNHAETPTHTETPTYTEAPPPSSPIDLESPLPPMEVSFKANPDQFAQSPSPYEFPIINDYQLTAHDLLTEFDQVFSDIPVIHTDAGRRQIDKAVVREHLRIGYVDPVFDRALGYTRDYFDSITGETQQVIQYIVLEIRKRGEVIEGCQTNTTEILRSAFYDLYLGAELCLPRRHGDALAVYNKLSSQVETVEEILLQNIQTAKETLFQNFYNGSVESVQTLNYIRTKVGEEFGLDCNPLHLNDPSLAIHKAVHIESNGTEIVHNTAEEFRKTFEEIYTLPNLVPLLLESINRRFANEGTLTTCTGFAQFIEKALQESGSTEETTAFPEPYLTADYKEITAAGIIFLLVHLGFFTATPPNSRNEHLVRFKNNTL